MESIEPGEYSVGKAVELLSGDKNVVDTVRNYQTERFHAATESHYGGEAKDVENAENALRRALEKRGVELEPVMTETGGDVTLATFADAFEKHAAESHDGAEVVAFPEPQGSESKVDDTNRREAA